MPGAAAKSNAAQERVATSATKPHAPDRHSSPDYADQLAAPLLKMQRVVGNQAVQLMLHAYMIQAKLTINRPGDEYEQEADRVADQVMRMELTDSAAPAGDANQHDSNVQRKCAECEEEEKVQRKSDGSGPPAAPPIVDEVLGSPGQPLDESTRSFFEPRFGHDFSKVRVHTDSQSSKSAESVNALAYTVGRDIVFAESHYAPETVSGRRLLGHELAHVVQQSGGRLRTSRNPVLQRQCVPDVPCPVLNVPLAAVFPRWEAAEKCLQEDYRRNHPGNVIGFNKDWLYFTARRPPEQQDIDCFKPHFVAISGMQSAEPDIFDFTATSIMEITTPSGTPPRVVRLGVEVGLANSLSKMTSQGCSGRTWFAGTWPPTPCYWLGGDLYIRAWNTGGILVYQIIKDIAKETVTAGAMAALYNVLKKQGPKAAGRRFAPGYAVAALIATGVTLASGKAEAKAGPGGEEPILTMFKALAAKGTKVPPEMQDALEAFLQANPDVKAKIEKAIRSGDVSAAQEELSKQALKIINEHRDEFSEEDLVALLTAEESTSGSRKGSNITTEALRKTLTDLRAGRRQKGEGQKSEGQKREEQKGGGQKGNREGEPAEPGAKTESEKYAGISSSSRARILGASTPIQRLFDAMVGKVGAGPRVTDESVDRFLAIVGPTGLGPAEANELISRLKPAQGATVGDVLSGLEKEIQQIRAAETKAEELAKDPFASSTITTLPIDPIQKAVEKTELIELARRVNISSLPVGESRFNLPDELVEGAEVTTAHVGRAPSGAAAGYATIRIVSFTDTAVKVLFLSATDMYDQNGNVVLSARELVGNSITARRLRSGKQKKK